MKSAAPSRMRFKKRLAIGIALAAISLLALFALRGGAPFRIHADPDRFLSWYEFPAEVRVTSFGIGQDQNEDRIPDPLFVVADPVGIQWRTLIKKREFRSDYDRDLVFSLSGSDGTVLERQAFGENESAEVVLTEEEHAHAHYRGEDGEYSCLTVAACPEILRAGVTPMLVMQPRDENGVYLTWLVTEAQAGAEGQEVRAVIERGKVLREVSFPADSVVLSEASDAGFGYVLRVQPNREMSDISVIHVDLLTGKETPLARPSYEGVALDVWQSLHDGPNQAGEYRTQTICRLKHEEVLLDVPLYPVGEPEVIARFPLLREAEPFVSLSRTIALDESWMRIRISRNHDDPSTLDLTGTPNGRAPQHARLILPSGIRLAPEASFHFPREINYANLPDLNADGVQELSMAFGIWPTGSTGDALLLANLILSGATGEILPRKND